MGNSSIRNSEIKNKCPPLNTYNFKSTIFIYFGHIMKAMELLVVEAKVEAKRTR